MLEARWEWLHWRQLWEWGWVKKPSSWAQPRRGSGGQRMVGMEGRETVGRSGSFQWEGSMSKSARAVLAVWAMVLRDSLAVLAALASVSWMLAMEELMSLFGAHVRKWSGQASRCRGESTGPPQMFLCFFVAYTAKDESATAATMPTLWAAFRVILHSICLRGELGVGVILDPPLSLPHLHNSPSYSIVGLFQPVEDAIWKFEFICNYEGRIRSRLMAAPRFSAPTSCDVTLLGTIYSISPRKLTRLLQYLCFRVRAGQRARSSLILTHTTSSAKEHEITCDEPSVPSFYNIPCSGTPRESTLRACNSSQEMAMYICDTNGQILQRNSVRLLYHEESEKWTRTCPTWITP
ncbi:hypothetical protein KC19_4G203000 [Ceratodon purpureus]|uniref:Uncharacterized protein n=1 Tax=Ceratodon purpureus TaxID=3225 RepID=A0A8T0IED6_CERPU|nr:hypothetical protein KC19_4G203000 [Ceratodon purpureus]